MGAELGNEGREGDKGAFAERPGLFIPSRLKKSGVILNKSDLFGVLDFFPSKVEGLKIKTLKVLRQRDDAFCYNPGLSLFFTKILFGCCL
jgi:hypothetical protein